MSNLFVRNQRPDLYEPPPGQPHVVPRIKHHLDDEGHTVAEFVYPWAILPIRAPKDVPRALDHYAHPAPMMEGSNAEKSQAGMRYLVEWVYPTLRWYCRVYGMAIPEWLRSTTWAENLTPQQTALRFGPAPLNLGEWREDKRYKARRGS